MKNIFLFAALAITATGCSDKNRFDATGAFEATEVIVAAEQSGRILALNIMEGDSLAAGQVIGGIDVTGLMLQRAQREANVKAITERTIDPRPQLQLVRKQLDVQESRLQQQLHEKSRITNLLKADAATRKELDDVNATIDQLQKEIAVSHQQIALYQSDISTQNRTILSEKDPASRDVAIVDDQIKRGTLINPVNGTVLTQYAYAGEYATIGKALYKIADLNILTLRAYITGSQLPAVKMGQQVHVFIDTDEKNYKEYPGTISWISDKAEFTPKTIQTKEERANLVYAIKITVKNDGFLKIGMYSEVKF